MINMIEKKRAVLITFTVKTNRFNNNSERNKFYKELYGWKQIVKKERKRYVYRRDGLLDEIPNVRVDRSMFIIMKRHMDIMRKFLEEWEDKIKWDMFDVLLDEEREKMLRGWIDER
jgi:hypothetical protein